MKCFLHCDFLNLSFLDENMRKTYCDIKIQDLNSDNGVNILLSKLKSLFAKEINQALFIAYGKFEMFKGPANKNIVDFINEFARLYKIYDIQLLKECKYICE